MADPNGIWYTSVSGIWQTVWLEPVPANHITAVKTIPDLAANVIRTTVSTSDLSAKDPLTVTLLADDKVVAEATATAGEEVSLPVAAPRVRVRP